MSAARSRDNSPATSRRQSRSGRSLSRSVSNENVHDLADEIVGNVEERLRSIVRQEQRRQSQADEQQRAVKLSSVGNQQQFDYNYGILSGLKFVKKELKHEGVKHSAPAAYDRVLDLIEKVEARQKTIRIADQSGWDTVAELERLKGVLTKQDEKDIRLAAEIAARKRRGGWAVSSSGYGGWPQQQGRPRATPYKRFGGAAGGGPRSIAAQKAASQCHYCHEPNHWIAECPKRAANGGGHFGVGFAGGSAGGASGGQQRGDHFGGRYGLRAAPFPFLQ